MIEDDMVHLEVQNVAVQAPENGNTEHGTGEIQRLLEILEDPLLHLFVRPGTCVYERHVRMVLRQHTLHRDAPGIFKEDGTKCGVPSRQLRERALERAPLDTRRRLDGKTDVESGGAGSDLMPEPVLLLAEGQRKFHGCIDDGALDGVASRSGNKTGAGRPTRPKWDLGASVRLESPP